VPCLGCGLVYQSPRPRHDDDFIRAAYDDSVAISNHARASDPEKLSWKVSMEPLDGSSG
jgi:hypothetical protein